MSGIVEIKNHSNKWDHWTSIICILGSGQRSDFYLSIIVFRWNWSRNSFSFGNTTNSKVIDANEWKYKNFTSRIVCNLQPNHVFRELKLKSNASTNRVLERVKCFITIFGQYFWELHYKQLRIKCTYNQKTISQKIYKRLSMFEHHSINFLSRIEWNLSCIHDNLKWILIYSFWLYIH